LIDRQAGSRYTSASFPGGVKRIESLSHSLRGDTMMSSSGKRIATAIALLVVFAVTQTYLSVSLAAPGSSAVAAPAPQQTTAVLTTGAKPITINGASAITGATIVSGATIETPDQGPATVNIPGHGSLQIAANTKLILEFDQNGNIKVNLIQGCLVLLTKKGTTGEIDNAQGVVGKSDGVKDSRLDVCPTRVAGAAAAGAGAGGLFGLGTAATVAIVGGIASAIIVPIVLHGSNPSPSAP
jgi:hypothetical protein